MTPVIDYEDAPYGSSHWADFDDIRRAGLLRRGGVQMGFYDGKVLNSQSDSPIITIAGAGTGKGRDVLIQNALLYPSSMSIFDPKGEVGATTLYYQHMLGIRGFVVNPFGLHNLPSHRVNPLDILTPESATFHSDSKFIAENFIALPAGNGDEHFAQAARRYVDALQKFDCMVNGSTSLPRLYRLISMIEGNPEGFAPVAEAMQESGHDDLRQAAGELIYKREHAGREFTAIMGTVYNAFSFMSEKAVGDMLEGGDFSLSALTEERPVKIYKIFPAEFIEQYASLIRVMFAVEMLYKQRKPQAATVLYLVEEAATLKKFSALETMFTFGRGGGNRCWAVFQDIGQIQRYYGREALSTFLGSAQTRQFFGVRDYDTAQLLSNMLGQQTILQDDHLQQNMAEKARLHAGRSIMNGEDPVFAMQDVLFAQENMQHQRKQGRALLTPDEILNLPEDRQILFISGKNCPPILGEKVPYFSQRKLNGKYLNNPFHETDRVRVRKVFGSGWRRVEVTTPPPDYLEWPQFSNGVYKVVR